jgi:hypothetical protein
MPAFTTRNLVAIASACVALAIGGGTVVGAQRSAALPEHFHAMAVQLGADPGQTTVPVEIAVNRWSTTAEQDQVMNTLLEQPAKLLSVLQKMPAVGRLSTPGDVGFELRYAQRTSEGGTDRILLLTDRPVGFGEITNSSRTLDYPITVIELRVQPSGKGDGKVAVAAKLSASRISHNVTVEDWNISPITLNSLERDKD